MLRRDFLKWALATTATFCGFRKPAYAHPQLGKYIRHSLRRTEDDWYEMGRLRYVAFPVEVVLEVEFEKGRCELVNFNSSKDLQARMEQMSPHELFQEVDWEKGCLLQYDPVSIVNEYYPDSPPREKPNKTARFTIRTFWWKG